MNANFRRAALKLKAELAVGAALRGFGTGIEFQQTEAVEQAGRQAAGARCPGLCSYFHLLKLEPGPFPASPKDTPLVRLKRLLLPEAKSEGIRQETLHKRLRRSELSRIFSSSLFILNSFLHIDSRPQRLSDLVLNAKNWQIFHDLTCSMRIKNIH